MYDIWGLNTSPPENTASLPQNPRPDIWIEWWRQGNPSKNLALIYEIKGILKYAKVFRWSDILQTCRKGYLQSNFINAPSKKQTYQNCFQKSHLHDTEVIDNIFYLLVWAKRMQGGGRKSKTKGGMVHWKQSCFYETHNQVLFQVDQCLGTSVPSRSKTLQGFKLGGMGEKSVSLFWGNWFAF